MSQLLKNLLGNKKMPRDKILALAPAPDYSDGRTKQSFKDETDINKILHRAQLGGTLSHLEKYQPVYGDYADFDFLENQIQLSKGNEVFNSLPSEIRSEFRQSPAAFFAYVNDPANKDDLLAKLPGLAAPGRQNIDVSGKTTQASSEAAQPSSAETPEASTASTPETPPAEA